MAKHHKKHENRKGRRHSSRIAGNCPLGRIDISHEGYGFVETQEGTYYVPANRIGGAMNGDIVEVRPRHNVRGGGRKQEAVVMRVHKRALESVGCRRAARPEDQARRLHRLA